MKTRKISLESSTPIDEYLTSFIGSIRPKVLYHYCLKEGFEGILSNHCMWLSNNVYMNDKMEGKWLDNIIDKWKLPKKEQWIEVGHIYEDYKLAKSTFFISCFSEMGDLLSQWRAYADDGKGMSIGFTIPPSFLKGNLTLSDIFQMNRIGGHLESVVYDKDGQKKILARIFRYVTSRVNESLNPENSALYEYFYDAYINTGKDCLTYASRLMKHPGFAEEREWRIIYDGLTDLSKFGLDKTMQTRVRGNTKINFYTWKFPHKFITKIVLGPKCAMTVKEVKDKLAKWRFQNVSVTKSQVPYR